MRWVRGWMIGVALAAVGCRREPAGDTRAARGLTGGDAGGGEQAARAPAVAQPPSSGATATDAAAATAARPEAATPPSAPDEGTSWTAGVVDRPRADVAPVLLRSVRSARQAGFDRVVFEFDGEQLPGYRIEYVDRPVRACGSGAVVAVAGDAWLAVRLTPAQAHDDDGRATVTERVRAVRLPVVRELRALCDFEAHVDWVLGVGTPNRYRVLELHAPTRLVVDVMH